MTMQQGKLVATSKTDGARAIHVQAPLAIRLSLTLLDIEKRWLSATRARSDEPRVTCSAPIGVSACLPDGLGRTLMRHWTLSWEWA